MPISIYLAEAILHSSQLVSKDQSSLVLERMPTSLSNLSCSNTTRFFHFIGFTEPCWWSWLQYEPFSKTPTSFSGLCRSSFKQYFLSGIKLSCFESIITFCNSSHGTEFMQNSQWQIKTQTNKQLSWLSCTFYFTKGQNSAKHSSSPSKSGWHSYLHERSCRNKSQLTSQSHLTSNVKQHNQVFLHLDSLKLSSILIFQSALHLKAGHSPETLLFQ